MPTTPLTPLSSSSSPSSSSSSSDPSEPAPVPTLLSGLPAGELARLRPGLERVRLELRQVLYEPGEAVTHVYFPIDALISLLTVLGDGSAIETGLVGGEGMAGLSVFLHMPVAYRRAVCQQSGDAWRLDSNALLAEVDSRGELLTRLLIYTNDVLRVAAQTAACNRVHSVEERCARWLLMIADRLPGIPDGQPIAMTQEYMAAMLGVRRASVVVVLGTLARAGLIQHAYGAIAILNRQGLEDASCECYRALRRPTA